MTTQQQLPNPTDVALADLEAVGEWERSRIADLRAECAGCAGSAAEDIAADILFTHYGDFYTLDDIWNLIEQASPSV